MQYGQQAPAAVAAAAAVSAGPCPQVLHVVGRAAPRENSDICGEYGCVGLHAGRMAYRLRGGTTAIRYMPQMRRWVIDREGLRDSAVCVAYADDASNVEHPGHPSVVWHVWESRAQAHVVDPELAAVDAPGALSVVGRSNDRQNSGVVGEYTLVAVHYGRPAYRQLAGDAVIKFYEPDSRWLISASDAAGNVCSAFADGANAQHPRADLVWHFWESQRSMFIPDLVVKTLPCPMLLHVIGRAIHASNARICGTYHVAGVHDGRPIYAQPGTQNIIRYSAKSDRWLIDCDGAAAPSLMSKLYHWILNGDSSAASDRCSAFAAACGTAHPGFCTLEWQVWETQSNSFKADPLVKATVAPLAVRVRGRENSRENGDIAGEYYLAGTHCGRPAYMQMGTRLAIRYWAPMSRWVIDREGLRNSGVCVAYMDALGEDESPAQPGEWHVFESSRGCHLADPSVAVVVPEDAPTTLQSTAAGPEQPAAPYKRVLASSDFSDSKRMRAEPYPVAAAGGGNGRVFATLGA